MRNNRMRGILKTALFIVLSLSLVSIDDGVVLAAGFRPQITIINSDASLPEPEPDNTGNITWIAGQEYEYDSGEELVVEVDYDLRLFKAVYVNNKELTLNTDYHLEEGSTIISFDYNYVKDLPLGKHEVMVAYNNGEEFYTSFNVYENEKTSELVVPDTGSSFLGFLSEKSIKGVNVFIVPLIGGCVVFALLKMKSLRKNRSRVLANWSKKGTQITGNRIMKSRTMVLNFMHDHIVRLRHSRTKASFRIPRFGMRTVSMVIVFTTVVGVIGVSTIQQEANVEVNAIPEELVNSESLAITTSNEEYNQEIDLSDGSVFVYTSQNVVVNNATRNGYQLFVSTNSDKYNDLSLNGSIEGDGRIVASDGTTATPQALDVDNWGYMVEDIESSDTPSANSLWIGVPVLGSENLIKSLNGSTATGSTTKVYYGFNVTNNLSDGNYWGTGNSTVIYRAVANPILEYYINYNCNGGSGIISSEIKEAGKSAVLNDGASCSKANARLVRWNTAADGSGTNYELGTQYDKDADLQLFAVWEAMPELVTYTLSYNTNGGAEIIESQSQENRDGHAVFNIMDIVPTREGYDFLGWNENSGATEADYNAGDELITANTNTVLYAVWKMTPVTPEEPSYTHVLKYNANGGSGAPGTQTQITSTISTRFIISSVKPTRNGYDFKGWALDSAANVAQYQPGASIDVDGLTLLYAVWELIPETQHTFSLQYDANGGSGAPATQTITTTNRSATFIIDAVEPSRSDYTFMGWSTSSSATLAGYQAGNSINVTASSTMLYAVWKKNESVKVTDITIAGDKSEILLNSSTPMATLTATVAPSNATNKSVSWSSSNNNVAKVSSNGIVTATGPGRASITVQANDGSGKRATYNITVKKKVIVIIGASQVVRFKGASYANIKEYSSSKGNVYKTSDGSLNFVAKSGTGFEYQISGEGWTNTKSIINGYSGSKEFVEFYVYFPMAGNGAKEFTCGNQTKNDYYISNSNAKINAFAVGYRNSIKSLRDSGYQVNGIVVSLHPVRPLSTSGKYVVANSNTTNRCKKEYRSNYKYYQFNKAMNHDVSALNYANLQYLGLFHEIMDTSNDEKYTRKAGWTDYETVEDGIHWNNATAKKYFNFMLGKNGSL